MATGPPTREAVVVVLDVTKSPDLALGRSVCRTLVQQKLVYSPRDHVGLILGATAGTNNRLNRAKSTEYRHLSVARPVMAPDIDVLKVLDDAKEDTGNFDMLDALVLGQDLLQECVADRRFNRRILLVTSATGSVKRKEDLGRIIDALKGRGITVVVIGIGFEDGDAATSAVDDWSVLTPKQQNERVLHFLTQQLGGDSIVVPVTDAATALGALRKRNIPQRAYCKLVLDIGPIRIPVAMTVKTLIQSIPSMGKRSPTGDELITDRRYFSTRKPDVEMDATNRVKAFRYGRSVIPFNEVDDALLKFESRRSMSALGFVPMAEIPAHLLQGGSRAVSPLPTDPSGAKALSAFIRGMHHLSTAMLVRFVYRDNSDPSLGVCFPSPKATRGDILYFAALPFAEDFRHFSFRKFDDIHISAKEQEAVDDLVDSMDLDANLGDDDALKPKMTFNPALQSYYSALQGRFLHPSEPLETLPKSLAETSCHWGEGGNILAEFLKKSAPSRKRVRELFPPAPASDKAGGEKKKGWWFQYDAAVAAAAEGADDDAPPPVKAAKKDNFFGSAASATSASDATGDATSTSIRDGISIAAATGTSGGGATAGGGGGKVTTVDPVASFLALVNRKGEDNVLRAVHEMEEVILTLLRVSIRDQHYKRCAAAVDALRAVCVKEAEPHAFNKFLSGLMHTVKGGTHGKFWAEHIQLRSVGPITRAECEESDLTEEEGRNFFADRESAARPLGFDDEAEDDIFGALE